MLKQESVEGRDEDEVVSFREVLDLATRDSRGKIGSICWPHWSRERQINEVYRVFKGERNLSWTFAQACFAHGAAEPAIEWLQQNFVSAEPSVEPADPVVLAALRTIKAAIGHVEKRVAIRRG